MDLLTADGLSARTSKAKLQALRKGDLATALRGRRLEDQGLKPELVDRLYTALQQGDDVDAASAGRHPVQQPPAAADSAAAVQSAAASAVPVSQPAAAPAEAAEPTALSAELSHSAPAAAHVDADSGAHSAATSVTAPAAASSTKAARPQPQQGQQGPPECHVPTGLAVQWLGTSSGAPTAQRNVSSILLLQQRRVLMVDCGEGTVNQLAAAGISTLR